MEEEPQENEKVNIIDGHESDMDEENLPSSPDEWMEQEYDAPLEDGFVPAFSDEDNLTPEQKKLLKKKLNYQKNKEKYQTDPVYHKKVLDIIKKYQATEKGIKAKEKNRERQMQVNPLYISNYMKAKREKAKGAGICIRCFKNMVGSYAVCDICREKERAKREYVV